jgi:hypothetical protein
MHKNFFSFFYAGMFGGMKEMSYICSEKSVINIKYY